MCLFAYVIIVSHYYLRQIRAVSLLEVEMDDIYLLSAICLMLKSKD